MDKKEARQLLYEFVRYLFIGGLAFLVDSGVLILFNEIILPDTFFVDKLYIAVAIGFIAGLVFNYIFSILFVFKSARSTGAGRSAAAFIVFALIGLIGLGLTELGMWIGADVLNLHYILVKIVVTGIVLMWNYLGRKILIFK